MTLQEIKDAVDAGKTVHWRNKSYYIVKGMYDYFICYKPNENCIGLTWADGVTMNGHPYDFYIAQ